MIGKEEVKPFLFTDNMIFYSKKIKKQNKAQGIYQKTFLKLK